MAEPHEAHDAQIELFRLLHIGHHVTTDEVKYAYEQQMAQATRSGDFERAMKLLAAYERLEGARKRQVYGRVYDGRPTGSEGPTKLQVLPSRRAAARQRHPDRKWGMSGNFRVLVFGIVAPLGFLATAVSVSQLLIDARARQPIGTSRSQFAYPSGSTPVTTTAPSPATGPTGWISWRLPVDAQPGSDGLVRFVCAIVNVAPLRPVTLTGAAWPGALVSCPPGTQAVVLRADTVSLQPSMTGSREP